MPVAVPSEISPIPKLQQALAAPVNATVAQWSGSAFAITRPFHVDGSWELQWTSGGMFSATLHKLGSNQQQMLALATEPTSSSAFQPEGGEYYFEFTATEPWSAKIVSVAAASQH